MLFLYRIYQICIMLPLMLVDTVLASVFTILGTLIPGTQRTIGYYVPKVWARVMAWVTPVRVLVHGRENIDPHTSYVFVANHQGAYDIFAIYGFLNHNFVWMMKKSLERIPLVGYACRRSGHIFVDRAGASAVQHTMETAENRLQGGRSVVVFPEGTRSRTGKLGVFRRGAYKLAVEFNLPVVPITIDGSYAIMPITAKLPRPGRIVLTIHKPIMPGDDGHDVQQLMEQSRQAIASSLPADQR